MSTSTLPAALVPPAIEADQSLSLMLGGFKGGIGKTTSAWLLMLELAMRGHTVLGVDADPVSQTLADSYRIAISRGFEMPFTVISWPSADGMVPGVRRAVEQHGATALVVDTGGDAGGTFDAAGILCDDLLVPVAPNEADLRRLPATFDAAERVDQMKSLTGGALYVSVLLVKTNAAAVDAAKARTFLDDEDKPLLRVQVPDRVFYRRAFGHVPPETGAYRAVLDELLALRAVTA
jgi:chromosome partitioning protein